MDSEGRHTVSNGYLLPDPLTGYETECLTIEIPKHPLYRAAIVGQITQLIYWWNWQRTGDNSGSIAGQLWRQLIIETLRVGDCDTPVPSGATGAIGNGESIDAKYEKFLELFMELDVKFSLNGQLYEAAIPLVPCGCGSDSNPQDVATPTPDIPGASQGGVGWGEFTTLCDFSTTVVPFMLNQVDDFIGTLATGAFWLNLADILSPAITTLANSLIDSTQDIEGELTDPGFIEIAKTKAIQEFNDPINSITREDLRRWARSMPVVYQGAPMQSAFILWAEFANVEAINIQIGNARGTGNQAECEVLFARVGRDQFDPSDLEINPPPNTDWISILDFRVSQYGTDVVDRFGAGAPYGTYVLGIGWETQGGLPQNQVALYLEIPIGQQADITYMLVDAEFSQTLDLPAAQTNYQVEAYNSPSTEGLFYDFEAEFPSGIVPSGISRAETPLTQTPANVSRVGVSIQSELQTSLSAVVYRVVVGGTGTKPTSLP